MYKVICNSSPVIGLTIIGKLNLLWELFEKVYVPEEVYKEIVNINTTGKYGALELQEAIDKGEISVYKVKNQILVVQLCGRLHRGELEVIFGAKELGINVVVIDEKSARSFAETMLLDSIGIIGILLLAKKSGKIVEVKKELDLLINNDYRVSKELYERVLLRAGEQINLD
jgi:predicted nucleic acid-binding protein